MEDSFIKLSRRLLGWEWFHDSNMVHLFIYLLIKANYVDSRWQGVAVKRGQLITGRKSIANATGISERKVRTGLDKLLATKEIAIKASSKHSLVTIVNYEKYQDFTKKATSKTPTKTPTSDQRSTTSKELKKKKKEKDLSEFDIFRKLYQGTKRGNETEFNNFCKKTSDWESVLIELKPALIAQAKSRTSKKERGLFIPEWKNLTTWINNRCWEEITEETKEQSIPKENYIHAADIFPEANK